MANLIPIQIAQLHSPIFVGGKNFSDKLQPLLIAGLQINYDRKEKELLIDYKGIKAIVPATNIVSMTPMTEEIKKGAVEAPVLIPVAVNKVTAQYESPMSHVFAGPGAGKTGQ